MSRSLLIRWLIPAGLSVAFTVFVLNAMSPSLSAGPQAQPGEDPAQTFLLQPGQFRQLLPRDAIRPVYEPSFVSAAAAELDPDELVLGVETNGATKAYPISPLNRREMVNDELGGVPILVTWCKVDPEIRTGS